MSLLVISHHFIIPIDPSSMTAKPVHVWSRSHVITVVNVVNVAVSIVDTNAANTPFAEATVS